MKKITGFVVLVVLAVMAIPSTASAQQRDYPPTTYRVNGVICNVRYTPDECLRIAYGGNQYDNRYYDQRYDRRDNRRYDRRDRRGKGSLGSFIAGAVIGGVVTAAVTHNSRQQEAQEVPQGDPNAGPGEGQGPSFRTGSFTLTNSSRVDVDVYDGDKRPENFVGTLEAGESFELSRPRSRYRGWAQMPNEKGGLDNEELKREITSNKGWTFIEPDTARGR